MSDLGNKEIMAKNIRHYLSINGISQTDICKTLNFKMSTFSDWIHARTYPRIDKIELMAIYFGINKSDLVEEHKETSINYLDIETLKQLNRTNIDKVNVYSRNLLNIQYMEDNSFDVIAAHERADTNVTNEMIEHDNDIMDDDNF